MTEIPEDVMRAAIGAVSQEDWAVEDDAAYHEPGDIKISKINIFPIALAILAERERCCSVLRGLHEQQNGETFDTTYLDIEEIIRNGA